MEIEKISCPKCGWEPVDTSIWICTNCKYEWNTFDTYGRCPECGKIHEHTQCLDCGEFSDFNDWIEKK